MMSPSGRALISGTLASLGACLSLALCGMREGRSAYQPMNATSHWLRGDGAAFVQEANLAQTAAGYATHHSAATIWAYLFEVLRSQTREDGMMAVSRDAAMTAAIAAAIDYTITPHRLTPGWELILSKQCLAAGYVGMAAGLILAEKVLPLRQNGMDSRGGGV